jgi:hypothetical protein
LWIGVGLGFHHRRHFSNAGARYDKLSSPEFL